MPIPYFQNGDVLSAQDLNEIGQELDDTGWIKPPLLNGWNNAAPAEEIMMRRRHGIVYFSGRPTGGATGTAFMLPVGWRPIAIIRAKAQHGGTDTFAGVIINPTGQVQLTAGQQANLGDVAPFPGDL